MRQNLEIVDDRYVVDLTPTQFNAWTWTFENPEGIKGSREKLLDGPRGRGGTTYGVLESLAYGWDLECNVLILRRFASDLTKSNTVQELIADPQNRWCPDAWIQHYYSQTHVLKLKNGRIIQMGGIDQLEQYLSTQWGYILIEEAIQLEEKHRVALLPCLRGFGRDFPYMITYLTNPGPPGHWLHRLGYPEEFNQKPQHNFRRFTGNTEENLHNLPVNYIENTLEILHGIWYKRFRLGQWIAAEGQIYDCFDPKRHVLKSIKTRDFWPRIRSIDFGFDHAFVCQWWIKVIDYADAIDMQGEEVVIPDGSWVMYREIYTSHETNETLAAWIVEHSEDEVYQATYRDHDLEDAKTLEDHGVPNEPALKGAKSVVDGITWAYHQLARKPAKLYFLNDVRVNAPCPYLQDAKQPLRTVEEFTEYKWKSNAVKDEPIKLKDNGMDCMRYGPYSYEKGTTGGPLTEYHEKQATEGTDYLQDNQVF